MGSANKRHKCRAAIILLVSLACLLLQSATQASDGWKVLPIRSEEEFNQGMIGGEAEQHLHGISRSLSDPNIIYWSQDVTGPWKDISYNLPRVGAGAMAVNPHTGELFIGGACGTWVLTPPYESRNLIYDKCIPP